MVDGQVALLAALPPQTELAGPTSNSPGGTSAVLDAVDGSDCNTYVGTVKVPALAGAIHSTKMPGVVAAGTVPDCSVDEIAVISTKPLGSPPVQLMVSGELRDIGPVGGLVHLKDAAAEVTSTAADIAPTCEPPGDVMVKVPGTIA